MSEPQPRIVTGYIEPIRLKLPECEARGVAIHSAAGHAAGSASATARGGSIASGSGVAQGQSSD